MVFLPDKFLKISEKVTSYIRIIKELISYINKILKSLYFHVFDSNLMPMDECKSQVLHEIMKCVEKE